MAGQIQWGSVFKLTPGGTLTTLHSFNMPDAVYPSAGLVVDRTDTSMGRRREERTDSSEPSCK